MIVASNAQLCISDAQLRVLLRAYSCTSQAVLLSAASAVLLAPSRAPSERSIANDGFVSEPSTDTTADSDEPVWLREAGELVAVFAPSAAAVCSAPPIHHRLSGHAAEFADAPFWLREADAHVCMLNAQPCGARLALSPLSSSLRLHDSRLHVSISLPSMIATAPPHGGIFPLHFWLCFASLGARRRGLGVRRSAFGFRLSALGARRWRSALGARR